MRIRRLVGSDDNDIRSRRSRRFADTTKKYPSSSLNSVYANWKVFGLTPLCSRRSLATGEKPTAFYSEDRKVVYARSSLGSLLKLLGAVKCLCPDAVLEAVSRVERF